MKKKHVVVIIGVTLTFMLFFVNAYLCHTSSKSNNQVIAADKKSKVVQIELEEDFAFNSYVLRENGEVYKCGTFYEGKDEEAKKKVLYTPRRINGLKNIKQIEEYLGALFAVDKSGNVYIYGDFSDIDDYKYYIGKSKVVTYPIRDKNISNVKKINVDYGITALLNNGSIVTTLINGKWQKVKNLPKIKSIYSTPGNEYAVTNNGNVYGWGEAQGLPCKSRKLWEKRGWRYEPKKPILIKSLKGIKSLSPGCFQTLALKKDGTVMAFGYNDVGQLGNGLPRRDQDLENELVSYPNPAKVKRIRNATQVWAIDEASFFRLKDGSIWACGEIDDFNGKSINKDNKDLPVKISDGNGIEVFVPNSLCYMYSKKDGSIWVNGCNAHWALGIGKKKDTGGKFIKSLY